MKKTGFSYIYHIVDDNDMVCAIGISPECYVSNIEGFCLPPRFVKMIRYYGYSNKKIGAAYDRHCEKYLNKPSQRELV